MRSLARVVLVAVVAGAGPVLSACSSLDSFDPSEWFESKKKLAGERRPVFPEGVPGVTAGVPPELVKGYHEPDGGGADPAKAAAEAAAEKPAKPKKPPPQRTASQPKPAAQQQPAQGATAPWPGQQQSAQPASAAWPSQQQPQQSQAPWPGSR